MDSAAGDIFTWGLKVATDPKYTIAIIAILLLAESVLSALIIRTVPYTETVLHSYVHQAQLYMSGVKDYTLMTVEGSPIARPALHVYICRFLASITEQGSNVVPAQIFFAVLYVLNLGLAMLCYKEAKVPNYVYPMLCLSKRLHSIYLLRCFDDGFTMTFFFFAIYSFQQKNWTAGALAFACGLGTDMSLLCAMPAVAVILGQALGPWAGGIQVSNLLQLQMVMAVPFLQGNFKAYFIQTLGGLRPLKHEGMVSWRFMDLERLASKEFAMGLLVVNVFLIIGFIGSRWLQPLDRSFPRNIKLFFTTPTEKELEERAARVTPDLVMTSMITSVAISMLCARSLQHESIVWIAWATPFLLWRSGLNPALQYLIWSGQELAWNQVPADDLSSQIIAGALAVVVVQVWTATDLEDEDRAKKVEQQTEAKAKISAPQRSKKVEQEANKIVNDPDWPI